MEVPQELEGGLTRVIREFADLRIMLPMALFFFTVLFVLTYRTHSAWVYFIPPSLGSLLASVILVLEPYNPYKNFFATLEGRELEDIKTDPNAQRLLFMLGSQKARLISIRTGFLLATSLCVLMILLAIIQPKPFISKLDPLDLVFNTFLFWAASFGVHVNRLLCWAFREWHLVHKT